MGMPRVRTVCLVVILSFLVISVTETAASPLREMVNEAVKLNRQRRGQQNNPCALYKGSGQNVPPECKVDRADVVNALGERTRAGDLDNSESTTLLRLRDMGLQIGITKNEIHTGCKRGPVNQHRMEKIS